MNWNLEGMIVEGHYMDEIPVKGRVTHSRVAYGGNVAHHVEIQNGFSWFNGRVNRKAGEVVILNHANISRVMDNA